MKLEVIEGTPNYERGYQEFNRILRDEQKAIELGDLNTISKLILTGVNFVVQWGQYSHERKYHHEIKILLAVVAVVDEAIKLGQIPADIASRWHDWQNSITAKQPYFTSLTALRNSASGRCLIEKAKLTDLEGERASIENRKSAAVEKFSLSSLQTDIDYFKQRIAELTKELNDKNAEIKTQTNVIETIEAEYKGFNSQITAVVTELKMPSFFTAEEIDVLDPYLVESSFEDSTFAVFETDVSGDSNNFSKIKTANISFADVSLVDVKTDAQTNRRIFNITGGEVKITGKYEVADADGNVSEKDYSLSAELNYGTLDHKNKTDIVFSAFVGHGSVNSAAFPSGTLTVVCTSNFDDDKWLENFKKIVNGVEGSNGNVVREDVHYEGSASFSTAAGTSYFTRNATDYQRYSVEQALYDYAVEKLVDIATPTYEFNLSAANFIWLEEYKSFRGGAWV